MKKINIIKFNRDFDNIIKNGKYIKSELFNIYYIDSNSKYNKYGISVPKKIGNAVIRNKIKRQIKNIIDNRIEIKNKKDVIIIIKNRILDYKYGEIENKLVETIKKI